MQRLFRVQVENDGLPFQVLTLHRNHQVNHDGYVRSVLGCLLAHLASQGHLKSKMKITSEL